jgi:P27 family predicted phage terminase small subunit
MAGRKPKPKAMKELHGNPGKRPLNANEPQFSGFVRMPDWVPELAKEEFTRVVEIVGGIDLLKATDQAALEAYAVAYARWRTAEAIVDEEGQTVHEPIVNKAGEIVGHKIKRHPATIVAKDERLSMLKAASLFGFDPSSRSRVQVPEGNGATPDHDDDGDEDIFAVTAGSGDESGAIH